MWLSFSLGKKPSLTVRIFQIMALEIIIITALISATNNFCMLRVLMLVKYYYGVLAYWEL